MATPATMTTMIRRSQRARRCWTRDGRGRNTVMVDCSLRRQRADTFAVDKAEPLGHRRRQGKQGREHDDADVRGHHAARARRP